MSFFYFVASISVYVATLVDPVLLIERIQRYVKTQYMLNN